MIRPAAFGLIVVASLASVGATLAHAAGGRLDRDVVPTSQAVRLALDARQPSYRGSVRIELRVDRQTDLFRFHSEGLTLNAFRLTAGESTYEVTPGPEQNGVVTVRTAPALEPGEYTLAIDFTNEFDTKATSLYRLQNGGQWYSFTQFESDDAREAFPCWDEPEFKIPWQLTLIVPKEHMAIANTPPDKITTFETSKTVVFRQSPPMPSYLVAMATGPFETVEIPGLAVPGRIVTVAGQKRLASEAARVTPPILRALEDYFGRPYPFEKLDIIGVPEFWYGAMENPGAITFVDRMLLLDPATATPSQRRSLVEVMAHELAHMWFGDLVTMKWWDDLWLNESFASWMGDKVSERVFPDYQTDLANLTGANGAMTTDSRLSTRPIRQTVSSAENLLQIADDLAYNKGQAVLGMFEQWLGEEEFRAGVRRYIDAHTWGNAEADDLWQALSAADGPDVGASMATFLDQPGMPLVSLALEPGGKVTLTQQRFLSTGAAAPGRQRWSIPVTLRYPAEGGTRTHTVLLDEASKTVSLPGGSKAAWVLPSAEARGYYRWSLPDGMLQLLADRSGELLTPRERIGFLYNLSALLQSGRVTGDRYLRILKGFCRDPEPRVLRAVADGVDRAHLTFVTEPLAEPFARFVRETLGPALDRIGPEPWDGEPETATELRPRLVERLGNLGRDPKILARARSQATTYLENPSAVQPTLADTYLHLAALRGDRALFDTYKLRFEKSKTPNERRRFLESLGWFRSETLSPKALAYSLSGPMRPQELLTIPRVMAESPELQDEVYQWFTVNYETITQRMPAQFTVYLPWFAAGCSAKRLEAATAFFDDPRRRAAGTEKEMARMTDEVQDCVALRTRESKAVAEYLNGSLGKK